MPLLKVSELQHPHLYVRSNIKDVTIKDLLDVAKNNKNEKKELVWPFPPIEVVKDGKKFEILDGNRRTKVAKLLKLSEIPATIKDIKSPADRFLYQIQANLHGLMLDKDQRDNSIRLLGSKFKMSLEQLAKTFKLTKASISRILKGKQRKTGPRKQTRQNQPEQDNSKDFAPKGFMERTLFIADEYAKNRVDISEFLKKAGGVNKSKLAELIANLNSLTVMLEGCMEEKQNESSRPTA